MDYLNEFQKLLSIYLSDQRKLLIYTHLLAVQKNRFHFGWRTYVYIRTYTINQHYIQAPRLNFSFILWFWKFLVRHIAVISKRKFKHLGNDFPTRFSTCNNNVTHGKFSNTVLFRQRAPKFI